MASYFDFLLEDFFCRLAPSEIRKVFDPAGQADAVRALSSPRGVLALTFHGGFGAILPHFFVDSLDQGLAIDNKTRSMCRSIGAGNPGAALFAALCALREGRSVYVAPDCLCGKLAGSIEVLGARNRVGDGAPFLAYQTGCDTVWYSMRRNGRLLVPVVEPGPTRAARETFEEFRARMIDFYRSKIEERLTGDPDDLVIGKMWRRTLLEAMKEKAMGDERTGDVKAGRFRP